MNETSKGRRLTGKLAILVATVVALPLTATVVPVFAEEKPATTDTEKKVEVKKHKIVVVKNEDGKSVVIDTKGDAETPFVKTIERDGKTIVLRTNKELSEAEVEKMVAEAEASRAKAEAGLAVQADGTKIAKRVIIHSGSAADGAHAFSWSGDGEKMAEGMNISAYIPDIYIKEFRGKCEEGQPVSADVSGFDGKNKSRVKIVMCGKGQVNIARREAVKGLKQAVDEIRDDADMPESIRKDVIKKLEEKIRDMEKQIKQGATENGDA